MAAQQDPSTIPWNSIMCSAPGRMAGMISRAAGASATHGEAPWPMVAALVFTATLTLLFFFFNGPVVDLEKSIVRPS